MTVAPTARFIAAAVVKTLEPVPMVKDVAEVVVTTGAGPVAPVAPVGMVRFKV